jgi:hypothetical protein
MLQHRVQHELSTRTELVVKTDAAAENTRLGAVYERSLLQLLLELLSNEQAQSGTGGHVAQQ